MTPRARTLGARTSGARIPAPARVVALACAGGLVLGACAAPGYDTPKVQRELVAAGVAPDAARCITDRLEADFDMRDLGLHVDPTEEDVKKTRAILETCGVSPKPPR